MKIMAADWLVSEEGEARDDRRAFGRRAGDTIMMDIYKMLGRMEGIQQEQSESMKRMSEILTRHVAQEDMIASMAKRIETLTAEFVELSKKLAEMELRVSRNRSDIDNHAAADEPVKDFFVRHMTTIITAGLAMLGTALISKLPEIVLWFKGL